MNVLAAWELGGNWGHVARDLPVLRQLQAQGHDVRYVVRDATIAPSLCASTGISCMAAPNTTAIRRMPRGLAGFGAILFADGFGDAAILRVRLTGWMQLFAEHKTNVVMSDYAPAALLAARICGIPSIAFGSGFEIPQDLPLLPSFLPDPTQDAGPRWFTEGLILFNINRVLRELGTPQLERLAQVFQGTRNVLTTVAELDHCGARSDATYVGPVQNLPGGIVAIWKTAKPRVLVYLRGSTPDIHALLQALSVIGTEVIAVLPDMDRPLRSAHTDLQVFRQPVRFDGLIEAADLVIAAGQGTVTTALLSGVPVLMLPANAEQAMLARRVEAIGAGMAAGHGRATSDAVGHLLHDAAYRAAANAFAAKYASLSMETSVQMVIDKIHQVSLGQS
jgi:hypothetical protein